MKSARYILFSDTVGSTNSATRVQHFNAVEEVLKQNGNDLIDAWGQYGDEHVAIFKNANAAFQAAKRVHNLRRFLSYGLAERIGLDVEIAEVAGPNVESAFTRDAYQTITRAKRIMEICPPDFTLISEDFWNDLPPEIKNVLSFGNFFAKLKSFLRPAAIYSLPQIPEQELEIWHARWKVPVWADVTGLIRAGGFLNFLSEIIPIPAWYFTRDEGYYKLGRLWFRLLHFLSRASKWRRLEFQSLVGLADVSMLDGAKEHALRWHHESIKIAEYLGEKHLLSIANYQRGHRLAHFEPSEEAERLFRTSYLGFEELGDPRWAGWAAIYLGRCLRGLAKDSNSERLREAENWILAGIVISVSRGVHKRQLAYAMSQMTRLRARQGDYRQAAWYIKRALELDKRAIGKANDDAPWEEKIASIKQKAAVYAEAKEQLDVYDFGFKVSIWASQVLHRRSTK